MNADKTKDGRQDTKAAKQFSTAMRTNRSLNLLVATCHIAAGEFLSYPLAFFAPWRLILVLICVRHQEGKASPMNADERR